MTGRERVQAIADYGFTERQARFLVLVMQHGGVCVPRQYATFAGVANGGKGCNAFFERLLRRDLAVTSHCLHNRARLYYVRQKALYAAVGLPSRGLARVLSPRNVIARLMRLDAVLTTPEVEWLTSASALRAYLGQSDSTTHQQTADDHAHLGADHADVVPAAMPVGVDPTGRLILLYLVTDPSTEHFRRALQGAAAALRLTATWRLRVAFPRPLHRLYEAYQTVLRDELETPLHAATVSELKWYFTHRREASQGATHPQTQAFLSIGAKRFVAARFTVLYERWLQDGDRVFDGLASRVVADALNAGHGTVECVVLSNVYRHLSPLVAEDREVLRRVEKGDARGDVTRARPQPPVSTPSNISMTSALL
jgi:hypothetical protein